MFNHDVIDLFGRVPLGTQVVIRTYEDSLRIEGPALSNRGIELPPFYTSREELNDGIADQRPPVPEAMINPDGSYSAAVLDLIARLEAEAFAGTTVLVPEDPLGAGTIGG
jgi:hypothetical protein